MKRTTRRLSFTLFCLLVALGFAQEIAAQRLMGYYPYYRRHLYERIDFSQLTDITYAWLNADNAGKLQLESQFNLADFTCLVETAKAINPHIRIHVSSGGWGHSSWLYGVGASAALREKFARQLADFVTLYGIDGWDLDWEFPSSAAKRGAHEALVRTVREVFDETEEKTGRRLSVSIAVGGDVSRYGHVHYYTNKVADYVDAITVMAYDDGNRRDHSTVDFAMTALRGYHDKLGWPLEKMLLGVPFYARKPNNGPARSFQRIVEENPFDAHTRNTYGEFCYNGLPTLQAKADSTLGRYNGLGLAIWELGHDHADPECSLLAQLNDYLYTYYYRPEDKRPARFYDRTPASPLPLIPLPEQLRSARASGSPAGASK